MYCLEILYWHKDTPQETGVIRSVSNEKPSDQMIAAAKQRYLKIFLERTGYNRRDVKTSHYLMKKEKTNDKN